jgi:hypothetical protein
LGLFVVSLCDSRGSFEFGAKKISLAQGAETQRVKKEKEVEYPLSNKEYPIPRKMVRYIAPYPLGKIR